MSVARVELSDLTDRVTVTSAGLIMPGADAVLFADGGTGNDQLVGARGGGELRGGAGHDELKASAFAPWSTRLDGGEGNDRLVGADGYEELHGGGGQDELHGGGGNDTLSDGDRSDASGDSGPGPDLLDGGSGQDIVSYRHRTVAVFVDLADARSDGEPGEGDKLTSIESLEGGRGDDRLAGDGARNSIDGGAGENELRGRGGRDEFRRAGGRTVCGKGYDVFLQPRATDFLEPDCEAVTPNPYAREYDLPAYPAAVTARAVAYRFHCYQDPDIGTVDHCSGTVTLRKSTGKSRRLAAATIPLGRWKNLRLTARLTRLGRQLVSRPGGVRAIMRIGIDGRPALRWTIGLTAKSR